MNTFIKCVLLLALVIPIGSLAAECPPPGVKVDIGNAITSAEFVLANNTGKTITYKVEPVVPSTIKPVSGTINGSRQVRVGGYPKGQYRITFWLNGMMSYKTYNLTETTTVNVRVLTAGNVSWLDIY